MEKNMMNCYKKRFQSRKEAKRYMKKYNHFCEVNLQYVYKCSKCEGWHGTSQDKSRRNA